MSFGPAKPMYHFGRIVLCLALTFQGLYIMGFLPNKPLLQSMSTGLKALQTNSGFYHEYLTLAGKNIPLVAKAIGGLIALAALNILSTSRFIIKLNIAGLALLTILIGIPYEVIKGKESFLSSSNEPLFYLYSHIALIGGLIYYHEVTRPRRSDNNNKKED